MNFETNTYALIKELKDFQYELRSIDHVWDFIFPDKKEKFYHIIVNKYHETYYLSHVDGDLCGLEIIPGKEVKAAETFSSSPWRNHHQEDLSKIWGDLITYARKWLVIVKKDWIKANKKIVTTYPLNRRQGYVPHSVVRELVPDVYDISKDLGKAKTKKFIRLVEEGYFHDRKKTTRESMTLNDYFDYCRIAYIAAKRKGDYVDEALTGREMYERYADGRHEGLLDIKADSKKEFADWIDGTHPKRESGGHPWEIKRGGNTTHIDLYVSRPSSYAKEDFKVTLSGASRNRLKETIEMFLAIYDAGLPITISDAEGIRKRLLAQDNVGVIPEHDSLHRANQEFGEDVHVNDVLHLYDLGRYKRSIIPFIIWEPLPILKPVK